MKKQYIYPSIAENSLYMPLLSTLPVSDTETHGQLTKERIEDEEEMDEEMIMLLRDIEEGNTGNLW